MSNFDTATTRAFTIPTSHLSVLEMLARERGLTVDQALAQAIRVYQAHVEVSLVRKPLSPDYP